jgi:hypothetical protein
MVGIDFRFFAFSHCRDVVAAVRRTGGFGALGDSPEQLKIELDWIDAHVDGKPYGDRAWKLRPTAARSQPTSWSPRSSKLSSRSDPSPSRPPAASSPVVKERLLAARSGDTMRSRALSGKPARQLKSAWSQAWESTQSPGCLPMPFEALLSEASQALALRSVEAGNSQASKLLTEGGGQGVGMLNTIKSAGAAVQEFKQDFADSVERLQTIVG